MKPRRLLGLVVATAIVAAADTYPRQAGIDIEHYSFAIRLSDASDVVQGEATITVRIRTAGLREAILDLASLREGKGMTVDSVSAPFRHEADRLYITLPAGVQAGAQWQFTVQYHGVPASGLRIGPNKFKERTFFALNWPNLAHQWLPCIDHPSEKANSEFRITAPVRYRAVANGLLIEERDLGDGYRFTHWRQSVPIAAWLNVIGVAQFSTHHAGLVRGVPLETWVYHQEAALGPATFEATARRAIEFFSDRFGKYPYEKLANVEAPGFSGAIEKASAILYSETAVGGERPLTSTIAHEIAHQWFGDSVTESDWDDVWLSEGFATYGALLFTEHYEGRDAFVDALDRAQRIVTETEEKVPGRPIVHRNIDDPSRVLNSLVYQKAGWVLHMLRGVIGTENFWKGMRAYYARYRDSHATSATFQRTMEEVAGRPLGWFFAQWLHQPGTPVLRGAWRYDAAKGKLMLDLEQTQGGDVFRLPLELAVDKRVEKFELTAQRQHFEFPLKAAPAQVKLDPNFWVLMDAEGVTGP